MLDDRIGDFVVEVTRHDGRAVVSVRGEIDLSTADQFRAAIEAAMDGRGPLEIDLAGTTFMDSSGLAVLVAAHRRLGQAQEALVVRDPGPSIRKMLEISGVGALLDVRPALADERRSPVTGP